MKYWINVVSKDHLQRGIAGGFTQANHGKPQGLRRLSKGDRIIFYSPKTAYEDGEPLQAFTAIAEVTDDEPYQVEMFENFHPFRRNVRFLATQDVPIKPLLDDLEFIEDKTRWGYRFRFGLFQINEHDYQLISSQML